mgnify:CR=1 FL=1
MESVPYVELFNNTECSKVQANHPLIALHFYSQFFFISSLFRSIYFHLAFPPLCPFSFARLRVTLWLRVLFGLFYCFSQLYVHFLLPGSVFPSGFRMFLDFFTAFLSFMSIFLIAFTPVSVFPSGFRRILDFFPGFLGFISIWKSIEVSRPRWIRKAPDFKEFGSLKTAMSSDVSGLRWVRKAQDCDKFRILRTAKIRAEADKKASYHLSGKRNS